MIAVLKLNIYILLTLAFNFNNCGSSEEAYVFTQAYGPRIVNFAGYEWIVSRTGEHTGYPGPNYFSNSEENVWVDSRGRLHLRITNNKGRWECAGVILRGAKSYGNYTFRISTNVDKLDKNIVAGLFLYRDDHNEADIEFSRWGEAESDAGQFVVQPSENKENVYRFSIEKAGNKSSHTIAWQEDRITFSSQRGHSVPGSKRNIIDEWTYEGNNIPLPDRTKVMINLWLFRGMPPSDMEEAELVIDSFEIKPVEQLNKED